MEHINNIQKIHEPKYKTNVTAVVIFVGIMVLMMAAIAYAFLGAL